MTAWAGDYFQWLTTSKIGRDEDGASNNHGTFYDVQAVRSRCSSVKRISPRKTSGRARKRIARQIEPDGKMPRELTRTLSFNYSLFNLHAGMQLADLGRNAGVDLLAYQNRGWPSILKAAEFMAQFAAPARTWPNQQIRRPNRLRTGRTPAARRAEFLESKIKGALKFFRPEDLPPIPNRSI